METAVAISVLPTAGKERHFDTANGRGFSRIPPVYTKYVIAWWEIENWARGYAKTEFCKASS